LRLFVAANKFAQGRAEDTGLEKAEIERLVGRRPRREASAGAGGAEGLSRHDIDIRLDQFARLRGEIGARLVDIAMFDGQVLTFNSAKLPHLTGECLIAGDNHRSIGRGTEEAHSGTPRQLLRTYSLRPHGRRTA